MGHPDPKPHLQRVNFSLGCPRQNLHIFASPDTEEARLMLDQCRISGTCARTEKNVNGYAFVFKASYGPVGRTEQEYIHEWMLTQPFVTFEESEPSLEFEEDGGDDSDELTDADEKARRPAPMWEDGDEQPAAAASEDAKDTEKEPARKPIRRHADRKTAAKARHQARDRR